MGNVTVLIENGGGLFRMMTTIVTEWSKLMILFNNSMTAS